MVIHANQVGDYPMQLKTKNRRYSRSFSKRRSLKRKRDSLHPGRAGRGGGEGEKPISTHDTGGDSRVWEEQRISYLTGLGGFASLREACRLLGCLDGRRTLRKHLSRNWLKN